MIPLWSQQTRPWQFPEVLDYWDARYGVTSAAERISAIAPTLKGGDSLVQATGANQPILLPYSGENYSYQPGVNNNFPATVDILGALTDFSVAALVAFNNWTLGVDQYIVVQHATATTGISFQFVVTATTGTLSLVCTPDGTTKTTKVSTAAPTVSNFGYLWVLATRNGTTGDIKFWTAPDGNNGAKLPTQWTQLGTTVASALTGALSNSADTVGIGAGTNGTVSVGSSFKCKGAVIWTGIVGADGTGGTLIASPNFTAQAEGATSFSDAQSNTWTINATGAKYCQIIGRPWMLCDASAYWMQALMSLGTTYGVVWVGRHNSWAAGRTYFAGGAAEFVVRAVTASPQWRMSAGGNSAANSNWTLATKMAVGALFNGASSRQGVNQITATVNPGATGTATGLTVGADYDGTAVGALQVTAVAALNQPMTEARLAQLLGAMQREYGA